MRKLVSLGGLSVRNHIQKLWRYRTIKDEIAVKQLNFFDSLISLEPDRGCNWCWFNSRAIVAAFVFCSVRIWAVRFLRLENRVMVIVLVIVVSMILISREICQRVFFVGRRLIWGLVVCVMMSFRVECVVLVVIMCGIERIMLLEFFVVTIRIVYVFDRVLQIPNQLLPIHIVRRLTVGCACNLSLGVCLPGPIGISRLGRPGPGEPEG